MKRAHFQKLEDYEMKREQTEVELYNQESKRKRIQAFDRESDQRKKERKHFLDQESDPKEEKKKKTRSRQRN